MHPLSPLAGTWTGTCAFRLMPTDDLVPAPSAADVTFEADGWGALLRYTWTHAEEGPQHGIMLISSPDDEGRITCGWIDSFHQKPALGIPTGELRDGGVHLEMEYMGWGWTIDIRPDGDTARMVMNNVIPEGFDGHEPGPYVVMDAVWQRV